MRWQSIVIVTVLEFTILLAPAADLVWVEAERFEDYGGWVNDAQFIDQMGSPYLLATGMGESVKDAITHLELPRVGRWHLWIRSKDWAPLFHPGRFNVLINGQVVGPEIGAGGESGWQWTDAGIHELGGKVELHLHDLTGYYGRCDAIVFASDADWTPPVDRENIAVLREKYGGVSRQIEDKGPYDVVVIGGGLAGCTAAVAAARKGAEVVLIQNRPVLGGNASTEILVPPVGVWPSVAQRDPLDPRETGLVEEYRTAGNQKVKEGVFYSDRLMRFVKLEPNLALYLNTHATGVEMVSDSKNRIATVLAVNVKTGQRMRFLGKMFIDCTGDSIVGVTAGAEYRQGKESQSMYQEPWAPATASQETMGNGLKYYHQDTGKPQLFVTPSWAFKFPKCEDFSTGRHPRFIKDLEVIGHQWMIELGGFRDTYADAEEIRDDLFRLILGMWDHSKNHCLKDKDLVANHKLAWIGHVAGKRENRRLIGDYVLTQNDIGDRTLFPDRVIYGGWSVDDHYSAGFFHRGSTGQYTKDWERAYVGRTFSIPFRSLYSRNIDNLLMAGRNISASHLAMSDTRVMLTCALMGQAVGAGAALCIERQTTPRGIYEKHLEELQQQLLKDGNYIIDLPNRDPRDLARQATATASSEGTCTNQKMAAVNVINGYARTEDGKPNAWMPDKNANGLHWVELSWSQPQIFNIVHVVFQTAVLAPKHFAVEIWQDNVWKQIAEVKENQYRRHVLGLDRQTTMRLRVVLDETQGICEVRIYNESKRLVDIARRAEQNMQLPDTSPQLPWEQH